MAAPGGSYKLASHNIDLGETNPQSKAIPRHFPFLPSFFKLKREGRWKVAGMNMLKASDYVMLTWQHLVAATS